MLQQVDRHLRRPQVLRGPARGPVRHAPRWGPFQVVFDVTSDRGDTWHLAASRADVRITSFTPSRKALRAIGPAKVRANPQATWVIGVIDLWGSKTLCGTVAACPSTAHSSNSSSSRGDSPASTTTVWSSNEHHSLSISSDRSRGHSAGSVYHPLRSSSKSSW